VPPLPREALGLYLRQAVKLFVISFRVTLMATLIFAIGPSAAATGAFILSALKTYFLYSSVPCCPPLPFSGLSVPVRLGR